MSTWVNFKELRACLDFEQVLKHYKVDVRRNRDQHHGFCPLPDHNGKRNSPSFSANLKRGIFQCFGCGKKGNLLEFASIMEGVDPNDGASFRQLAIKLQNLFCPAIKRKTSDAPKIMDRPEMMAKRTETKNAHVEVNALLNFELKGLQSDNEYLASRGFSKETIAHFGLGLCSRGLLKDRIAIPLVTEAGLIGYAGRLVSDSAISDANPKYRFPGEREHNGKVYQFRKSLFLYNGFRLRPPVKELIVVEGFSSVWWLTQNGFPNVVAVMGTEVSDEQLDAIMKLTDQASHIWLIPDGDKAGEHLAKNFLLKASPHRFVRWLKLESGQQPTELSSEKLEGILEI